MGTRTIGVRELKARASEVLREAQETGEEVIVTVRGRPVARLEPLSPITGRSVDGMGGLRGALSGLPRLDWDDFADAARVWEPRSLDGD